MKHRLHLLTLAVAITLANAAHAQLQGPSSSQNAALLPSGPNASNITTTSVLTAGDVIGGYKMVGIPDGLGAFDNGDGTFTVLMNHELGGTAGITRAHGATGAFVSKWVIDKSTFAVNSGSDLIQNLALWNGSSFNAPTTGSSSLFQLNRLCSADLAPVSAFYNSASGLGTQDRIFLSGEEAGAEGRAFAHVATGANAGTSYQLPHLGRFSWENAVANFGSGDTTAVLGTDDSTPGQVYLYLGTKTNTGSVVDKAGLTNGSLYGIKVTGAALESRTNGIDATSGNKDSGAFTLASLGNVANTTGAALQTASTTAGVTEFLRPEDIAWDPNDSSVAYFVTTDQFSTIEAGTGATDGRSRLWKLDFSSSDFTLGGNISMLLEGAGPGQMFDNLTVTLDGKIIIQEDPGNNAYLAKVWEYDIAGDTLTEIGRHDASKFVTGGANFITQDEEASGVIDITSIINPGALPGEHYYLMSDQIHASVAGEQVEQGQLTVVHVVPEPSTAVSLFGGLGMFLGFRKRRRA